VLQCVQAKMIEASVEWPDEQPMSSKERITQRRVKKCDLAGRNGFNRLGLDLVCKVKCNSFFNGKGGETYGTDCIPTE
jgi:hypothetical protein